MPRNSPSGVRGKKRICSFHLPDLPLLILTWRWRPGFRTKQSLCLVSHRSGFILWLSNLPDMTVTATSWQEPIWGKRESTSWFDGSTTSVCFPPSYKLVAARGTRRQNDTVSSHNTPHAQTQPWSIGFKKKKNRLKMTITDEMICVWNLLKNNGGGSGWSRDEARLAKGCWSSENIITPKHPYTLLCWRFSLVKSKKEVTLEMSNAQLKNIVSTELTVRVGKTYC